jgi:CheY-like chemotaxis protein
MIDGYDLLVVEDEPVVLSAIKRIVESENISIDEAGDVETALKKLHSTDYKLLITDLMLPKISGFDLLKSAKKDFPKLPVIVITGYATLESALQTFKLGSFDFIAKPFDIEAFLGVVKRGIKFGRERLRNSSYKPLCVPLVHSPEKESRPCDYYCLGGHAWIKLGQDGTAEIGIGETFPGMIDNLERIEFLSSSDHIVMGKYCAQFWTKDGLVNMFWAPLSGKVVNFNHELEKDSDGLNRNSYNENWLIRIVPTNLETELEHLTSCFNRVKH